jgi:hypothetical protein
MMRIFTLCLIVSGALGLGCSHAASVRDDALSPSQLNANAAHYNGAQITVSGYLKLGPESHVLYESKELDEEFKKRWDSGSSDFNPKDYEKYCLTIGNPKLLYENRLKVVGKTIVVKGRFVDNYLDAQHIDLGACPLPTAIIIDESDLKQRYDLR